MSEAYQYSYLIMVSLLMLVWIILFLKKTYRKEMLFVSIPFGLIGPILESFYVKDWWNPLTIMGSAVSIEDFFFSFAIAGIAAVLYEETLGKRVRQRKESLKKRKARKIRWYFSFLGLICAFYIGHYIFNVNTFIISISFLFIVTLTIWIERKDLIWGSLLTGIFFTLLIALIYTIVEVITPGWVEAFWYFKNTPEIVMFNLPLDDIIFYFLFGAAVGPIYEYWQEGRLIKAKN